ncbi:MAG: dihydrodipicolinate reductase C-terminal domain-containing protein [Candidatus Omnitrophota bacterium]|jgi:4-hydroxy-tetrahydrodipicolinate reductase
MAVKIGLFGFGKTGRMVAYEIINDKRLCLCWVIRKSHKDEREYASNFFGIRSRQGKIYSASSLNFNSFYKDNPVDVIIDFSSAEAIDEYKAAAAIGIRIVSAISRYKEDALAKLKKMSRKTAVLYSPNITLGVNFLIVASRILQQIVPNLDIEIVEEHFRNKKEVSGTALRIAGLLGLCNKRHVNSIRVGGVVGRHEVIFGFPNQTIRISHESINRAAFAKGAIYAAKWIAKRKKGLYTMEQVVSSDFIRHSKGIHKKSRCA